MGAMRRNGAKGLGLIDTLDGRRTYGKALATADPAVTPKCLALHGAVCYIEERETWTSDENVTEGECQALAAG